MTSGRIKIKATELIKVLEQLIEKNGDLEVKGDMPIWDQTQFCEVTIKLETEPKLNQTRPYFSIEIFTEKMEREIQCHDCAYNWDHCDFPEDLKFGWCYMFQEYIKNCYKKRPIV